MCNTIMLIIYWIQVRMLEDAIPYAVNAEAITIVANYLF